MSDGGVTSWNPQLGQILERVWNVVDVNKQTAKCKGTWIINGKSIPLNRAHSSAIIVHKKKPWGDGKQPITNASGLVGEKAPF